MQTEQSTARQRGYTLVRPTTGKLPGAPTRRQRARGRHASAGLLRAELEAQRIDRRAHLACLIASRAARQREAYAQAQRESLAQQHWHWCVYVAQRLGCESLPECVGRGLRLASGEHVVVTDGAHDHPMARVQNRDGTEGVVQLVRLHRDLGQWRLWEFRVLRLGSTCAAEGCSARIPECPILG